MASDAQRKTCVARQYRHHTLPVRIEDQGIFDAIMTMIAGVESAKARDHWKALGLQSRNTHVMWRYQALGQRNR
jgi:hypothetical protein